MNLIVYTLTIHKQTQIYYVFDRFDSVMTGATTPPQLQQRITLGRISCTLPHHVDTFF